MSDKTVNVGLKIEGDARGGVQAIETTEKALQQLDNAGKITLLEGAERNARTLATEVERTRQQVQALETTLSEAYAAGADDQLIGKITKQLNDAQREANIFSAAAERNTVVLNRLKLAAREAGIDIGNLAGEKQKLERLAQSAATLQNSFDALKIRTAAQIKADIQEVNQALFKLEQRTDLTGEEFNRAFAAAKTRVTALTAELRGTPKEIERIGQQLSELKMLYAAWIGIQQAGNAVADVAKTADAYANLSARIKMATGEGAAFQAAFQGIQDIALKTNTSLDSTSLLFIKLADAGKQMGIGQAEAMRLTETVNQAIQLAGASAQASDAALTQFIQGLQSGVLRGDEFNSIMEQAPRLAKALSDGLGVTTGELRKMAEAGQLSSQTVIAALRGQAAAVDAEFGKLPATIGRAMTDLSTQWQLWIGKLDESSGASKTAAGAIEALAHNLDLVASGLINAGQAYLGWKAYNIAAEFMGLKAAVAAVAAAKTADTAVTVANTTATAANTAAQIANNAAKAAAATRTANVAAAMAGLTSALSMAKGLSLAFLLTNIVDIGKWLGEAAAKAMGYGKVMEDNERQAKAVANATKAQKDADAELAQKVQLAADASLGLSARSKQLVADFGDLTKSGESVGEAMGKLAKELDLSNIKGIADAGAALDALAVKGKISADQVREAWQQALNAKDLQVFEANARAAFDDTEQGARRLAGVLEAQLGEALRRTGLDAGTLAAGVNQAAQMAINDFDVLVERLGDMKAKGVDTGIALAASLDQASKAATTEAAAKEVIRRWEELGEAGLVTGTRLSEGLEKARQKLDDIKPGINSLDEAFKTLGMKAPSDLNKMARSAEEAFNVIKQGSGYSKAELANVSEAFKRMAEAAIAANGGVASDTLRVQASLYGLKIEADSTGKSIVSLAKDTQEASDSAGTASESYRELSDALSGVADSAENARNGLRDVNSAAAASPAGSGPMQIPIDFAGLAKSRGARADQIDEIAAAATENFNRTLEKPKSINGELQLKAEISEAVNTAMRDAERRWLASQLAATERTVNISLNGKSTPVKVSSSGDADALVGVLKSLESDMSRAF